MSSRSKRYLPYPSSIDPELKQYGVFIAADESAPMVLRMHGWHGQVKCEHSDNVEANFAGTYNEVYPEMRGRGDAEGKQDANGWELQDAVDALAAHAATFPASVLPGEPPLLWGGSGGGGNVLGLVGKFPDLFAAAVCECGISDYGLWYAHDRVGEFRDELEGDGWIGGSPASNPEAYLSRGGRTTARNLLTPLLMVHGVDDPRVPYEQAEAYVEAAVHHDRGQLVKLLSFPGVGNPNHYSGMTEGMETQRKDAISQHLATHRTAPELPSSGTMVVAGYLRTRAFSVVLESVDQVTWLDYDLDSGQFLLQAPSCQVAEVTLADGTHQAVSCRRIELKLLSERLGVPIVW